MVGHCLLCCFFLVFIVASYCLGLRICFVCSLGGCVGYVCCFCLSCVCLFGFNTVVYWLGFGYWLLCWIKFVCYGS